MAVAALDNPNITTETTTAAVETVKSVEVELKSHLNLLQVAHESKDRRIVSRVLHNLPSIRRRLTANVLINLLELPAIKGTVQITSVIESALMSLKTAPTEADPVQEDQLKLQVVEGTLLERSAYILLLISVFLIDQKSVDFLQAAMESSTLAILLLQGVNSAADASLSFNHMCTFDPLLSRHYYFLMRCYELTSSLPSLHNFLMIGLRTASLRHDIETEGTIYNCILRLHLSRDDYESAQIFLKNSPFPKGSIINLNNQLARFHFYRARVLAISGKYSEAAEDLCQVLRKAPHGRSGLNFVLSVTKFEIVVSLLCGEIPDRSTFNLHSKALQPYLELTQSVRLGELSAFKHVSSRFQSVWIADGTHRLVERLEESVVRVGLRRLSDSYLRISFADISAKLELPEHVNVHNILVKALADGVLVGSNINDMLGCLESNRITDVYSTRAPQEAFSTRSTTLQNIHNDSVKAMRFPEKSKPKVVGNEEDGRRPSEEELMDEFMDADEDLF